MLRERAGNKIIKLRVNSELDSFMLTLFSLPSPSAFPHPMSFLPVPILETVPDRTIVTTGC